MDDAASNSEALIGQVIADRYRVDAVLGEGGMGSVFRCHHLALERDVAVKLLHPELLEDEDVSARFEREARSASRLEHPNVMQVLDFGSWHRPDSGREAKFMVLQLLNGYELADYLGEPMAPDRTVEIGLQIVRGLEHAHQRGIVHRDLKPENVFVTVDHEGKERLKIVDFGLAKVLSGSGAQQRLTRTGMVFGTPQYMSPEQATGGESDERTDIYALGIMLWELLVGRPPFGGDDVISIIRRQVSTPLPNEELPADTPAALVSLIDRMTFKEVDGRIGSAAEVRAELEVFQTAPGGVRATAATVHQIPAVPAGGAGRSLSQRALERVDAVAAKTGLPRGAIFGIAGVSFALALTMIGVAANSGADGDESPAIAASGESAAEEGAAVARALGSLGVSRAGESDLAEVDSLIESQEDANALAKLDGLLKDHPDDARVHARRGQLFARQEGKQRQAIEAFDRAFELDPGVGEDDEIYKALLGVLRDPTVANAAVELAIARLGDRGGPFLVELVNRDDDVLSYEDRHRILDALGAMSDADHAANADLRLNNALDLWQAEDTKRRCKTFAAALDTIEADPHAFYVGTLHKTKAPRAKEPEVKADCEGLNTRRVTLAIDFSGRFPEADKKRQVPEAFAGRRRGGSKSSSSSSPPAKKKKFKLFN